MNQLSDQAVIVTGASQRSGQAIARCARETGATVMLAARRTAPMQALAEELGGATVIGCDVNVESERIASSGRPCPPMAGSTSTTPALRGREASERAKVPRYY